MHIQSEAAKIRSGSVDVGRLNYALSLAHGVLQAQYCGYDKLVAIEFGVFNGAGLLDICKAAKYFSDGSGIDIKVIGFDTGIGLPAPIDKNSEENYKDHPEIWSQGNFHMYDTEDLKKKLPSFCELILGDIKETLPDFINEINEKKYNVGFVSIDVDLYSSTVPCLKLFEINPERLLPAVPMYVDDVNWLITYNKWCGEAAAINEFNERNKLRKIEEKPTFRIDNFHVCHVLDHPVRTGNAKRASMEIYAKPKGLVHPADFFTI